MYYIKKSKTVSCQTEQYLNRDSKKKVLIICEQQLGLCKTYLLNTILYKHKWFVKTCQYSQLQYAVNVKSLVAY